MASFQKIRLKLVCVCAALAAPACQQKEAPPPPAGAAPTGKAGEAGPRVIELTVTEKGFEPSPLTVAAGQPIKLVVTRKTDKTCATELILAEHQINQKLPLDVPVEIAFTPTKAGQLTYGCAMDQMISGVLVVQ